MILRKVTPEDSPAVAVLLLSAMEEIVYSFLGVKDYALALDFLSHFVSRTNNQYSYQNCFAAVENETIIGAVNVYPGARLHDLRAPIMDYLRKNFNPDFTPEDETQDGEFYIDSLGVNPDYQGKGIGSKMLQFLIDEYVVQNKETLGLLVEEGNPDAKRLYLKLGFKPVGNKSLGGKKLEHLQLKP